MHITSRGRIHTFHIAIVEGDYTHYTLLVQGGYTQYTLLVEGGCTVHSAGPTRSI